ncbi:MAG: 2'-5' RNA ligase family protein [Flavobacterium sp.]
MKQIPMYSLVIFPTLEQQNLIKLFKKSLKTEIGWFGSSNSEAHITIINLENELALGLYLNQIKDFCKTIIPQKVRFTSLDSFNHHTFFISPDDASLLFLNSIITELHQHIGFKVKNVHAHMTIARGLDTERMKKAQDQFMTTQINFEFVCDCVYVRKFNDKTNQYSDIIEKINFR